ncbi:MAG: lipopolysaccharide kinase InaA family protein, partial [Pseudomonas sp.]
MSLTRTLRDYGRKPPVDIQVPLAGGRVLQMQQWLRILPGKRLVGRALLDGEAVLVKLFISRAAQRHWQRERLGIEALLKAQITTPALLSSGELEGGGYYLVSRFLDQAQSLQDLWLALPERNPENSQARQLVEQVLVALAQMHAQGLIQSDLHLGNFLQWQEQLYVIDGDAVSSLSPGEPISAARAEDNLGRFFAQLPVAWEEHVELLLASYLMNNSHRAINPEAVGR